MATIFYPPLSSIVTLDALPDELGFVKGGLESLLDDIYFTDLQYRKSARGDAAHYSLSIVRLEPLEFEVPGTGVALVINPGGDSGSTSQFPVTLGYEWGILTWFRDFDLNTFSFAPADFYQLALRVLGISERQLIERALAVFIDNPNPVDRFVDDLNAFYGTAIPHPTGADPIAEVLAAIAAEPGLEDAAVIVFALYVLDNTDLEGTRERLEAFFDSFFGGSVEDYLKELLIPRVEATLELNAALKFPRKVLVPLTEIGGDEKPEPAQSMLTFDPGDFFYSTDRGIGYEQDLEATLTPSRIGKTGFEIQITRAKLDLSRKTNIPEATADGRPEDFVGVFIEKAILKLPPFFNQDEGGSSAALVGRNLLIGTGGISGTVGLEAIDPADPRPALVKGRFGQGFEIGLSAVQLSFRQNAVTDSEITGFMKIPGFKDTQGNDAEVEIDVHIGADGDFEVTAREADGIPIRLADVVELVIRSLKVGRKDDRAFATVSGTFNFLDVGGFLEDNLPKDIEIQKLLIWDDGGIELDGGSLNLRDPKPLRIPPVELTITALHLGAHEQIHQGVLRRYKMVGFDGGLSVKPGGVDARGDGFKVYFTVDNDPGAGRKLHVFVRIESIAIDLIIPGDASPESASLLLNGYLAVKEPTAEGTAGEREYAGAIDFTLPRLKMGGSAAMRYNPRVPSFVIDVNLEISNPILLGSTGLGIYGFRGLVGRHFVASREHVGLAADAKWYQYYKAPPEEGIDIEKFAPTEGFSLGAGVSLATAGDAGKAFSSKIFFLLSLPEVFLLEGQAQILKQRIGLDTTEDPPFYALIAITGQSLEAALGVNYRVPDDGERPGAIATVDGLLELAFFFGDASAWYVNLGRESPDTKRIQVQLLSLFNAYYYMMLSPAGIRAGAGASFALKKRFGPVRAELSAYFDVAARISFKPKQLGGSIQLGGSVGLKIFRFGFTISVAASLAAEAPRPFVVSGSLEVCIRVLRKKRCARFSFTWTFDRRLDLSEIPVLDPGRAATALNLQTLETFPLFAASVPINNDGEPEIPAPEDWDDAGNFVIPLDSFIDIELDQAVDPRATLPTLGGITHAARHVELIPPQRGRSPQVKHEFSVQRVEVKHWLPGNPGQWLDYDTYAAATPMAHLPHIDPADLAGLKQGYWQLDHPERYTKLRLLSQTPFSYLTRGGGPATEELGVTAETLFCADRRTPPRCVLLADIAGPERSRVPGDTPLYAGGALFRLYGGDGEVVREDTGKFERALGLAAGQRLEVDFPEPTAEISLRLRTRASSVTFRYFRRQVQQEPDSSGLPVDDFIEILAVTRLPDSLTEPVVYEGGRPVDRISIEAGECPPIGATIPGFVYRYGDQVPTTYAGLIDDADRSHTLAFGQIGNDGMLSAFNADGRVLWSRRYRSKTGVPVSFTHGLVDPGGDFLVSGSVPVSANRRRHLVARLTPQGEPIWSFTYGHASTRFHVGLTRMSSEAFVLTGWNNQNSSVDDVELMRIDGYGGLLLAKRVGGTSDDQVAGIVPFAGGVMIFGESGGAGFDWDGFLCSFDRTLSLDWSLRVGTSRFDAVRAAVPLGPLELIVAGFTSPTGSANASSTFVTRLHLRDHEPQASVFDLFENTTDLGFVRLVEAGESWYLVAFPHGGVRSARVVRLNDDLSIRWVKRLELSDDHLLTDLTPTVDDGLLAVGRLLSRPQAGLLAKTDGDLGSCVTVREPIPEVGSITLETPGWQPAVSRLEDVTREHLQLEVLDAMLPRATICALPCIPDAPSTFLHELCHLPQSAAERDRTLVPESDVQADNDVMLRGLAGAVQPIWRPATTFAVHLRTVDRVSASGRSTTAHRRSFVFGFHTAGPVGHFHQHDERYQKLLMADREDQFPLASLRPYIDYRRSYPNADGRLTLAKPLFYRQPQLQLFFLQDYVYSMYGDWDAYGGLAAVSSKLEAVVLDPLDSAEAPARFEVEPTWRPNRVPRPDAGAEIVDHLIAGGEPCTEVTTAGDQRRGVHARLRLPDLQPSKAYTARFDAVFEPPAADPLPPVEVHRYVFQTSRYADFAEQILSYRLEEAIPPGAAPTQGEAVFDLERPFDAAAIDAARSVLEGTAADHLMQRFADRFDRLISGALELGDLYPAETTEFNVLRRASRILGILVRSPEPLNDPKMPADELDRTVQLTADGVPGFQAVHSKDASQVFLTDRASTFDLPTGIYRFRFKYRLFNGEDYRPAGRVDLEIEVR